MNPILKTFRSLIIFLIVIASALTIAFFAVGIKLSQTQNSETYVGVVKKPLINIGSFVMGIVKTVNVKEGDIVIPGQEILTLQNPFIKERNSTLQKSATDSSSVLERVMSQENVNQLTVRAATTGKINQILVREGSFVNPGMTVAVLSIENKARVEVLSSIKQQKEIKRFQSFVVSEDSTHYPLDLVSSTLQDDTSFDHVLNQFDFVKDEDATKFANNAVVKLVPTVLIEKTSFVTYLHERVNQLATNLIKLVQTHQIFASK